MLDPRTNLVLLLLAVVALAVTSSLWVLGGALALLVIVGVCAGLGPVLRRAMRIAVFMALLVFVLSFPGGGPVPALAAVLRLLAIVSASVLTLGRTSPNELGNALVSGGVPYPAAFVVMTAMQFVPVIGRRAAAVRDAQRARGIATDTGVAGLRHMPALVLPVLFQSFKLADELAEALESRGFSRPDRTFRRTYRLTRADWAALALAGAGTLAYVRLGGI